MTALLGIACGLIALPSSDPSSLARQLGDPSFRVRETAGRQLRELGAAAFQALIDGCSDPDPEIVQRSQMLLPHARFATIAEDTEATFASGLPGFAHYREIAGWDHSARLLFSELDARFHGRGPRVRDFNDFGGWFDPGLPGGGQPPKSVDLACYLMETRPTPDFDLRVLSAPWLNPLISEGVTALALRRLLAKRIVDVVATGYPSHEFLERTEKLGLQECVPHLLKVAVNPKADVQIRAQVIAAIGRQGSEREVVALAALVADATNVTNTAAGDGKMRRTDLGDVALAACVKLSGRKFADFGMSHANPKLGVWDVHNVGFVTDHERTEALRRWAEATLPKH